jgi:hypothetical protein
MMPALLLLLIPAWGLLRASMPARALFGTAAVAAIGIQGIGVFCYPRGDWDRLPEAINDQSTRFWDWRDNPIVRSAAAGVTTQPYSLLRQRSLVASSSSIFLHWDRGFYQQESSGATTWRWCAAEGELHVMNFQNKEVPVLLEMICDTDRGEAVNLSIDSQLLNEKIPIDRRGTFIARRLSLPPGTHVIRFHCDAPPITSPSDARTLVFRVMNSRVLPVQP